MVELTPGLDQFIPILVVLGGIVLLGIGWIILRTVLRLTMRLFMAGCVTILALGGLGVAVALFTSWGG